jgi:hypothetical protein
MPHARSAGNSFPRQRRSCRSLDERWRALDSTRRSPRTDDEFGITDKIHRVGDMGPVKATSDLFASSWRGGAGAPFRRAAPSFAPDARRRRISRELKDRIPAKRPDRIFPAEPLRSALSAGVWGAPGVSELVSLRSDGDVADAAGENRIGMAGAPALASLCASRLRHVFGTVQEGNLYD